MEFNQCPYCGQREDAENHNCLQIKEGVGSGNLGWQGSMAPIFWVSCRTCHCRGPVKRSKEKALESWNTQTNVNDSDVPWPASCRDDRYFAEGNS